MFGWLKDVANWVEDAISSVFKPSGGDAINTKVKVNGKNYTVYKMEDGGYYYNNGSKFIQITNSDLVNVFKNNKSGTYDVNYKAKTNTNNSSSKNNTTTNTKPAQVTPEPYYKTTPNTYVTQNVATPQTNNNSNKTTNTKTNTSTSTNTNKTTNTSSKQSTTSSKQTSVQSSGPDYKKLYEEQKTINESNTKRIEELENPKILSALDVAKLLGIDYNEANILKDYNKVTNEYYDSAIDELLGIRTDYDKNNTQYLDQIMDSYLESSKYAAPTASGKGARAANVLSTLISAAQSNALGDYDILQDINANNEARKKDLANNPKLAKQQYNDLGTTLSGLAANFDQAKTKAAINKLDAYTQHYAADTSYRSQLANKQAAKYSGLANAAATKATSAANKFNNTWDNYYNYYKAAYGSNKSAANAIKEMLTANQGS